MIFVSIIASLGWSSVSASFQQRDGYRNQPPNQEPINVWAHITNIYIWRQKLHIIGTCNLTNILSQISFVLVFGQLQKPSIIRRVRIQPKIWIRKLFVFVFGQISESEYNLYCYLTENLNSNIIQNINRSQLCIKPNGKPTKNCLLMLLLQFWITQSRLDSDRQMSGKFFHLAKNRVKVFERRNCLQTWIYTVVRAKIYQENT